MQQSEAGLRPYTVYLLHHDTERTYVGATVDLAHRLRQHNAELRGGARQTARAGSGWRAVALVTGFPTWRDALRFEYAWRRCCPRKRGRKEAALPWRFRGLGTLLRRDRWSSTSPAAACVPLALALDPGVRHAFPSPLPLHVTLAAWELPTGGAAASSASAAFTTAASAVLPPPDVDHEEGDDEHE